MITRNVVNVHSNMPNQTLPTDLGHPSDEEGLLPLSTQLNNFSPAWSDLPLHEQYMIDEDGLPTPIMSFSEPVPMPQQNRAPLYHGAAGDSSQLSPEDHPEIGLDTPHFWD
ncbi:hypothetical protein [Rhodopirellula sp. MGV]|uniref:hypothetical protein n=1 Tax=Rhodopirellula sp. MGV TaxID=2023130 RepID=UPI000BCED320|nr:hypothetical protein [Rhodopirellula sp. MGV]OYP36439.1 hypothetical protein CGZ80_09050 [Rhodopirellula sp. MGV]